MTVLVLFETVEGHTAKVAAYAAQVAHDAGYAARLVDLANTEALDLSGTAKVVLAASVHQRRHPAAFEAMVLAHCEAFARMPTLMISVSLSAAFPEGREEAQDYLDEMKMRTGFTPTQELLVAGAVQMKKYDYFAMQVVRFVLLRGRAFDPAMSEHVFTDWQALRQTVSRFLSAAP